ncbi:MAG: RCC1 domain-containing protein, partial [Roseiflexaceae bacterium]
ELVFSGVAAITAGELHTCARTTAGAVLCWGNNISGQLGDGSFTTRYIPTAVVGLTSGVAELVAGESHTCAITTGNRGMCWGSNFNGEVGDATIIRRNTPVNIIGFVP